MEILAPEAKTESSAKSVHGFDELHLAEWPMAPISRRRGGRGQVTVPEQVVFEKTRRGPDGELVEEKLVIVPSAKYGLPTDFDDDVLMCLVTLTMRLPERSRKVPFSREQIRDLLGVADKGENYAKIGEALHRWSSINLEWVNAWHPGGVDWSELNSGVMGVIKIQESAVRYSDGRQYSLFPSHFTWDEHFYQTLERAWVRGIDFTEYRKLRSATAKRLYRFLCKRFNSGKRPVWRFPLTELAYQHVGVSRDANYDTGQLKRLINTALAKLEPLEIIEAEPEKQRYTKSSDGWMICIKAGPAVTGKPSRRSPQDSALIAALEQRGVATKVARDLVADAGVPVERLREKIELVDWIARQSSSKLANTGGFLVKAIREDYPLPLDFETGEQRRERLAQVAERKRARRQAESEAEQERALEQRRCEEDWGRVEATLAALPDAERDALVAEAVDTVDPLLRRYVREHIADETSPLGEWEFRRVVTEAVRRAYPDLLPADAGCRTEATTAA